MCSLLILASSYVCPLPTSCSRALRSLAPSPSAGAPALSTPAVSRRSRRPPPAVITHPPALQLLELHLRQLGCLMLARPSPGPAVACAWPCCLPLYRSPGLCRLPRIAACLLLCLHVRVLDLWLLAGSLSMRSSRRGAPLYCLASGAGSCCVSFAMLLDASSLLTCVHVVILQRHHPCAQSCSAYSWSVFLVLSCVC